MVSTTVLWEYTDNRKNLLLEHFDQSWNWTSSFGEYYDGSTDYYTAETRFEIDINQDGTVASGVLAVCFGDQSKSSLQLNQRVLSY